MRGAEPPAVRQVRWDDRPAAKELSLTVSWTSGGATALAQIKDLKDFRDVVLPSRFKHHSAQAASLRPCSRGVQLHLHKLSGRASKQLVIQKHEIC